MMCKINCSGGCPDCAPDEHTIDGNLLWAARYVLLSLDVERPNCGYGKLAAACERAFHKELQ